MAVGAGAVRAFAVLAAIRGEFGMEPEVDQRVGVRARDHIDGTAVAAVAAARSAARHAQLASERKTPAAAVACFDVDVDFVNEHQNGNW